MRAPRKSPIPTIKPPSTPRPSPRSALTKKDQLIALLRSRGGVDMAQLTKTLGWLPHTVRAALTGLRKSGFTIQRVVGKAEKAARYRIVPDAERGR